MNIHILVFWHAKTKNLRGGLSDCTRFGCSWGLAIRDLKGPPFLPPGRSTRVPAGSPSMERAEKKNTHIHFPSQFPPPRSPVNLFCEMPRRVSASLAALPSPEMRSLRPARLIFTRWDCDRMENGERGEDEGGVIWFRSGKSEYGNCCGSGRL